MSITREQAEAGRQLLGWSQPQFAVASRVRVQNITDFETGKRSPRERNREAIRAALVAAGVEFTPPNGGAPG